MLDHLPDFARRSNQIERPRNTIDVVQVTVKNTQRRILLGVDARTAPSKAEEILEKIAKNVRNMLLVAM
jgi:hypothetical protein